MVWAIKEYYLPWNIPHCILSSLSNCCATSFCIFSNIWRMLSSLFFLTMCTLCCFLSLISFLLFFLSSNTASFFNFIIHHALAPSIRYCNITCILNKKILRT
uniref:Uncharacterized protein n=1 Tax=Polytomella parva TaxID=51329 RepID=A0A7S0YML9_9CHLO